MFRGVLENLSPGYFALTMGTGIVSVGLHEAGWDLFSRILLVIAAVTYALLWVLYIWRAVAFSEAMKADLRGPEMAFGYFTVVAGTDVLAVRLGAEGFGAISMGLVTLAAILWFIFGYALPWQVFLTRDGKPILSRVNGTWFIWAVASQSLAIGLSVIQPYAANGKSLIGLLAVLTWSVGVALYAGVAVLVLLRILYFGMTPKEFEPPYWVAMGAMAIAVVAGSKIIAMESTPMVDATRALIAGTVAAFWSYCLWLIPILVGAGVWRHVVHRVPLAYTPTLWSIVFPIGMFAVASINLGRVDSLPVVETIGHGALIAALLVWTTALVAMIRHYILLAWRNRTSC
ncbi:MAG: tellurite resistance/C4-dicarboxylate transporter family protein [Glutamicibacter sp.]